MQTEAPQHGWMIWLTGQIGDIKQILGQVQAGQAGNRQTVLEVYRTLSTRMDRIEDRLLATGNGHRHGWMKLIPWTRITLITAAVILLVTGHITAPELKEWIRRSLFPV